MSIHFKLNRGATIVTISRHYYVDNQRRTTKLGTLDFTSNHINLSNSLTKDEQEKAILWINKQKQLIEKAYTRYSRLGLVGGTPVVAESGKYNSQFKGLPGCNLESPAYSFLGCIKGARKLSLEVNAPSSIEMKEIIDNNELATLSQSIISAYCHKLALNHEQFAHKIYSNNEVEQLIEANLLISKFITASKIKQAIVRANGIEERVDQYFKELIATDEGYLIGKRLKVSTLLKQKNNPQKRDPNSPKFIPLTQYERAELNSDTNFNRLYVEKPQIKHKITNDNSLKMGEKLDKIHGTNFG